MSLTLSATVNGTYYSITTDKYDHYGADEPVFNNVELTKFNGGIAYTKKIQQYLHVKLLIILSPTQKSDFEVLETADSENSAGIQLTTDALPTLPALNVVGYIKSAKIDMLPDGNYKIEFEFLGED